MTDSEEIKRRRTFAIISHPDAGKTTLTEKLLLYGGAIHLAGSVKARKTSRYAVSDWMEIEKQRGISVTSSVMTFERDGIVFGNFEKRLPIERRGFYREYTVPTPGAKNRGARRIIAAGQPPTVFYYTDDHYETFRRIRE